MTAEPHRRLAVAVAVLSVAVAACAAPTFEPAGQGTPPPATQPPSTTPPTPAPTATATTPTTVTPPATTTGGTFTPTFLLDNAFADLGITGIGPDLSPNPAAVAGRTLWTDPEGGTQTKTFVVAPDGSHRVETTGERTELLVHDAATMTTEYWDPELALVIDGLPTAGPDAVEAFPSAFGLRAVEWLSAGNGEPVTFDGVEAVRVVLPPPDPEEAEEFDGPLGPTTVIYEAGTGFPLLVDRPDLHVETTALIGLTAAEIDPAWFRLDLPDDIITDRNRREWRRGTLSDLPPALTGVTVPGMELTDVFVADDGRVVASFRSGFHRVDVTWIPEALDRGYDPYKPDRPLPDPGHSQTVTDDFGIRILHRLSEGLVVVTGTDPDLVTAADIP